LAAIGVIIKRFLVNILFSTWSLCESNTSYYSSKERECIWELSWLKEDNLFFIILSDLVADSFEHGE